jgi:hypothetical protein
MSYENLKKQIRDRKENLTKELKGKTPNEELDMDFHKIDEKWQKIKRLIEDSEPKIYRFLFKKFRKPSVEARDNLNEIRKLVIELRSSILKQRQDNESDY